jgi:hypothetical protein
MSIDHRAYLFRYHEFRRELADLLYHALETSEISPLREFISRNSPSLRREDVGELPAEEPNVQRYADLALTKYYDPVNEGLSYGFDAVHAYLGTVPALDGQVDRLICGNLFGPKGKRLDPGYMGTGLLSPNEVQRLETLLSNAEYPSIPDPGSRIYADCLYQPESVAEVQESLETLKTLYGRAARSNSGLLLVDFNDRGVSDL